MHLEGRPERNTIPVNIIVDDRPALVVGGGRVGLRKVKALLAANAKVVLVCPQCVDELRTLDNPDFDYIARGFEPSDCDGKLLVYACTDDKHVNKAVLAAARARRVPCGCADGNWADGDFTSPAVARIGDAVVAVSTGGRSCVAARDLKDDIVRRLTVCGRELVVVGTSDEVLSSRRRAPFHLTGDLREKTGELIGGVCGVREYMIINTCNRIEIVAVVDESSLAVPLLERIIGFDRLAEDEYFVKKGFDAFRHLVMVAAGLESSLLGEFHVVSQLKEAFAEADRHKWGGSVMRRLGDEVMRVSKLVRHQVEELLHVAEIDQVAARYLSVHGGVDADTHVVVVGTGAVGGGVAESLARQGIKVTQVYHSKRPDNGIPSVSFDKMENALETADVVVAAVDSSTPVVRLEMAHVFAGRKTLLVDLGLPRNIDPAFDDYGHGVTTVNLDDLKLWHRVKTGRLDEVFSRADAVIKAELNLGEFWK